MCELLIRARRGVDRDPLDKHPGDVIVIMPDGHEWGKQEVNTAKFSIVKLPGVPVSDVAHLMEPVEATDPITGKPRPTAFRRVQLDLASLPASGSTVTRSQLTSAEKPTRDTEQRAR